MPFFIPSIKIFLHNPDFHVENGCLVKERVYTTKSKDRIELMFVSAAVLRPRGNDFREKFGLRNNKLEQNPYKNGLHVLGARGSTNPAAKC